MKSVASMFLELKSNCKENLNASFCVCGICFKKHLFGQETKKTPIRSPS